MRAHEFITEGWPHYDQDTIELVKIASDSGQTHEKIANDLGLSMNQVRNILRVYYPNRANKRLPLSKALTLQDKDDIIKMWSNKMTLADIAKKYGLHSSIIWRILGTALGDEFKTEMQRRRQVPKIRVPFKITPAISQEIVDMYMRGMNMPAIVAQLDNIVTKQSAMDHLQRLPNWQEIRAAHDKFSKIKTRGPTSTRINRPGEIGNRKSKGPSTRHTAGNLK